MSWTEPRLKLVRTAAAVAVGCGVLALSQATNIHVNFQGRRTWLFSLAITLPSWLIMAATAPIFTRIARRFSFAPRRWAESAVVHLAAGLGFAVVHLALIGVFYNLAAGLPTRDRFARAFWVAFHYLFYQDMLAYGAIIGMYLALHYSNVRAQLAEARLTALRAQLNPHFLFNTLNAVSTLALMGKRDEVTEMLGRLGDLLRATLDRPAHEVPLSAELSFVDDYIAIQRVRFADRFQVHRAIDANVLNGSVPSLLLQPIVENAVEHGIGRLNRPGAVLSIRAARHNGTLRIDVQDSGPGFPETRGTEGIGLANTRERLRELYGSNYRFEYGNLPGGGAAVCIMIPFRPIST